MMATNRGHGRLPKPEYQGLSYSEIDRIQREKRKLRLVPVQIPVESWHPILGAGEILLLDSWDKRTAEVCRENRKLRVMVEVERAKRRKR